MNYKIIFTGLSKPLIDKYWSLKRANKSYDWFMNNFTFGRVELYQFNWWGLVGAGPWWVLIKQHKKSVI